MLAAAHVPWLGRLCALGRSVCDVMTAAVTLAPPSVCRCGHPGVVHEHYRPGTDCALCDCPRLRRPRHRES